MSRSSTLAGIVLAGGAGRRLGGVDKPGLTLAGTTLLDRALTALPANTAPIVVVGPPRPVTRPVRWTREDPPGAGPVAALAAGLTELGEPVLVAVLAADLVGLRPDTVDRLVAAVHEDGAVLRDADGRTQWLVGVWRTAALRDALPAEPEGRSLRSVLGTLRIAGITERDGESRDIDVPGDLDEFGAGGR